MSYGYSGKILRVNLTTGAIWEDRHDEKWYRTYWGGGAIGAYYLLNNMKAGVDPLSPENILVFAVSPLVGVPLPGLSRLTACCKSPLTGGWGEAQSGGYVGSQIKRAGWDSIVIEGKAESPVYLYINDDHVEIKPARHLWGKTTKDTEVAIREENGIKNLMCATIGPAGEKLIRYASIIDSCRHAMARTGVGAAMGSKNLKALAVIGSKPVPVKDKEKITDLAKYFKDTMMNNHAERDHALLGTPVYTRGNDERGILPVKNFKYGNWQPEKTEKLSAEYMFENFFEKSDACYACTVKCKKSFKSKTQYFNDPYYGGPEYETIAAFGPLCDIDNTEYIFKVHEICNANGLDTISAGATIAFAMECYEHGILTKDDTNGLDLTWGNDESAFKLLNMIVDRQGFGDLLAEGSMRASLTIGKGSNRFVIHNKGQEFPMHEPRGKAMLGFAFSVSELGADHTRMEHDCDFDEIAPEIFKEQAKTLGIIDVMTCETLYEEKVREYYYLEQHFSMLDNLGCCLFTFAPVRHFTMTQLCEMASAITGWEVSLFELMKLGERRKILSRVFNVREGFNDTDDRLPKRFFEKLEGNKGYTGRSVDEKQLSDYIKLYYQMIGWDEHAVPTRAKLMELRLPWVANKIEFFRQQGKELRDKGNIPVSMFDYN